MASETPSEKPATSVFKEDECEDLPTESTKTYLSRMGDDPKKPINPDSLPSYRQKTNRMFSFKPKTGPGANQSSMNNFFSKFAFNK